MTIQEDLPNGGHSDTPIYDQLREEWPQLYAKHEVDKFLATREEEDDGKRVPEGTGRGDSGGSPAEGGVVAE